MEVAERRGVKKRSIYVTMHGVELWKLSYRSCDHDGHMITSIVKETINAKEKRKEKE